MVMFMRRGSSESGKRAQKRKVRHGISHEVPVAPATLSGTGSTSEGIPSAPVPYFTLRNFVNNQLRTACWSSFVALRICPGSIFRSGLGCLATAEALRRSGRSRWQSLRIGRMPRIFKKHLVQCPCPSGNCPYPCKSVPSVARYAPATFPCRKSFSAEPQNKY